VSSLEEINRDEWAGRPYLIELQGGPGAGRRFRWPDLPAMWRQPVQPPPAPISMLYLTAPVTTAESSSWIADYRRTGSVTDDGAHVYEFERFE
jgi:hypothetical protein